MMKKTGIELIAIERQEQIEKHGRTTEQDISQNTKYQLSIAAAFLTQKTVGGYAEIHEGMPFEWDSDIWFKMANKSYEKRLIIAGALLAAEIDRLEHSTE